MAIDDPTPLPTADPRVLARFLAKVKKGDDCWEWTAGLVNGYGRFCWTDTERPLGTRRDRPTSAQRVAWMLYRGPIPRGAYVLHSCDNRPCVRPDHLFLGTHASNMADMRAKGRGARGISHGMSRLSESTVLAIRAANGPGVSVAATFGVSQSTVSSIRLMRRWRHI